LNLKTEGMTVLFVEHDMHMVRHIADWVIVMAEGRIVAEGDPHEVMANPAVIYAYLGSHHDSDLGDVDTDVTTSTKELADDDANDIKP
jgi:neutral amino acid transport system ATP-binding protein